MNTDSIAALRTQFLDGAPEDPGDGSLERALYRADGMINLTADPTDEQTQLQDVFTDLIHWGREKGLDVDEVFAAALRMTYTELEDWAPPITGADEATALNSR